MIRYRIARFLLVLGVVFGFGSGFASLAWRHHGGCHGGGAAWGQHDAYREQLKQEFAEACVVAARNATPAPAPTPAVAPAAAPTVIIVPSSVVAPAPVALPAAAAPGT